MNDKDIMIKWQQSILDKANELMHTQCTGWISFDENGWTACKVCNQDQRTPAPVMEWE
jgi:hypothetical protein